METQTNAAVEPITVAEPTDTATMPVVTPVAATKAKARRARKPVSDAAKTKRNESRRAKGATAKDAVTTPKHLHPKGQQPAVRTEGHGTCPVTGNPTAKGKTFTGFGNDAKAKAIINGLLQEKSTRAHRIALIDLETVANPAAFRKVLKAVREAGESKIARPTEWFVAAKKAS